MNYLARESVSKIWIASACSLAMTLMLFFSNPHAELVIEITRGYDSARPIAIVPFEGEAPLDPFSSVIANDLHRSGRFQPLPLDKMPERPARSSAMNFEGWQKLGMEHVIIGRVKPLPFQQFQVIFELVDIYKGLKPVEPNAVPPSPVLLSQEFIIHASNARKLAHQISDLIYEKLTGEQGIASTKIAYVSMIGSKATKEYRLEVADADGFSPRIAARSARTIMSPAWSPDGTRIAYVSFQKWPKVQVLVQTLATGTLETVASYPGLNTAPAWSPDGKKLALTLSKDGNTEIYILDLATKALQRITHDEAIETEANWSPDGSQLIFTSDRGGSPQIYQYHFATGTTQRVTFEGDYNGRGRFTSDGSRIIMVNRQKGQFHIAVQEMESGALFTLTDSTFDESPSVAPNGRMILYATKQQGKGVLSAVSIDGRVKLSLPLQEGQVREPAWGPIPHGISGVSPSL